MFHMIKKRTLLVEISCTLISLNFYLFQIKFASLRGPKGVLFRLKRFLLESLPSCYCQRSAIFVNAAVTWDICCDVARLKRFVNTHMQLENDKQRANVAPLEKYLRAPMEGLCQD